MSITISNNTVSFNIDVSLDDLIFNIVHRSGLDEKQVKEYFEKNPQELQKYLKICKSEIETFSSDSLDENDAIMRYAEQIENKVLN